jgi:hypothetical protein
VSFDTLLIHTVMIFNPAEDSSGEDYSRYGDEHLGFDAGTPARARVQPQASTESVTDRDTRVQTFMVFLPASATLSALSYLEWQGKRLRIDGEPDHIDGRSGPHHIEATCQEVLG